MKLLWQTVAWAVLLSVIGAVCCWPDEHSNGLPVTFKDIEGDPRREDISRVAALRIMQGYPDGTFRPNAMVSEREFASVVDRLVVACPRMTKPTFDSKEPEDPISRLRAVVIIVRAVADKTAVESVNDPKDALSFCADFEKIPEWGRKYAAYAVEKRFLTVNSEFRAGQPITRSELAEILARCLPPVAPEQSSTLSYTGLLVDCTGVRIARSMSPAIECEDGTRIYPDPKHLPSIEFIEDNGLVSYVNDQTASKRVGDRPFIVKAIGVSGSASQVAVISDADKDAILEAEKTCHFLSGWNVAFLIAPK